MQLYRIVRNTVIKLLENYYLDVCKNELTFEEFLLLKKGYPFIKDKYDKILIEEEPIENIVIKDYDNTAIIEIPVSQKTLLLKEYKKTRFYRRKCLNLFKSDFEQNLKLLEEPLGIDRCKILVNLHEVKTDFLKDKDLFKIFLFGKNMKISFVIRRNKFIKGSFLLERLFSEILITYKKISSSEKKFTLLTLQNPHYLQILKWIDDYFFL